MKIILAFDSYKDCISATQACQTAERALRQRWPEAEIVQIPLSDGGEGLVHSVRQCTDTHTVTLQAHGPLMEEITAQYALSADGTTAYMEMAATSGLPLVPPSRRNPMHTTTYGVGEMLIHATRRGCQHIVMGIGGSATCDGGRGMLQALAQHFGTTIHQSRQWPLPPITVACDVSNPLYGPLGAAHVFAPQKGASPDEVNLLDHQLRQWARDTEAAGLATPSLTDHPGAGAAGGLGYGLMAYLSATLMSGIDIVLDITHFDELIQGADLVITGEGRSDCQTLMGKVPHGVLRRCQPLGIPVCLLSGTIDDPDAILSSHFHRVQSINAGDTRPLSTLLRPDVAQENLARTIREMSL